MAGPGAPSLSRFEHFSLTSLVLNQFGFGRFGNHFYRLLLLLLLLLLLDLGKVFSKKIFSSVHIAGLTARDTFEEIKLLDPAVGLRNF